MSACEVDQFRVCKSRTTGFYYVARFRGEMVSQDHPPEPQSPHTSFVSAYREARWMAEADGVAVSNAVVEFLTWQDIYTAPAKPKPENKSRGRK